jgi:hypothetical protein
MWLWEDRSEATSSSFVTFSAKDWNEIDIFFPLAFATWKTFNVDHLFKV